MQIAAAERHHSRGGESFRRLARTKKNGSQNSQRMRRNRKMSQQRDKQSAAGQWPQRYRPTSPAFPYRKSMPTKHAGEGFTKTRRFVSLQSPWRKALFAEQARVLRRNNGNKGRNSPEKASASGCTDTEQLHTTQKLRKLKKEYLLKISNESD